MKALHVGCSFWWLGSWKDEALKLLLLLPDVSEDVERIALPIRSGALFAVPQHCQHCICIHKDCSLWKDPGTQYIMYVY